MRLATRLFGSTSLLVAATVIGLTIAADRILRRELEDETAAALEREARLVASQLPADSLSWTGLAPRPPAHPGGGGGKTNRPPPSGARPPPPPRTPPPIRCRGRGSPTGWAAS